jgi:uncharacterized protein
MGTRSNFLAYRTNNKTLPEKPLVAVNLQDYRNFLQTTDSIVPFWTEKTLEEMSEVEWESLCDGCGRCCLVKLEDEENGDIHFTDVGCTLLEEKTCRCRDYTNRQEKVSDCVRLTPDVVRSLKWLPPSCAYRLVAEGKDLLPWHPLVSGDAASVHDAGISVRGRVSGPEELFSIPDLMGRIVKWPRRTPRRKKVINS